MIVPRDVNTDLQTYRAWVHTNDTEAQIAKRPASYLNQLNFNTEITDPKPSQTKQHWWEKFWLFRKPPQYQPSSGLASAAVSATTITGEPSLA